MIEVSNVQTEVTPLDVEVTASNSAEITTVEDGLDVTIAKKEYKIVGDEVYIAKLYDDAPQWMKDLVQLVVNNTVEQSNIQLLNNVVEQLNQFATSYVPLNTYTQQILDLSNADASMHTLIETINSNFNNGLDEANAQIIELENTKASKDEVIAQVLTTISSELATPTSNLGATIANLQQTIVDGDSANADSITTLTSVLEGEVDARASAVQTLNTYVGIDSAGASTGTGLSAYLEGSDGTIGGADSQVANGVAITNGVATSKWTYNSSLIVNGVTYNSGFGLSNSTGTGIGSEFWIDATRLKFTNSGKSGRTAPFTIDASGTTPQITFNGKVSFSNVTGAPGGGSNLLYNSAPMVANETKGWSVGAYNTGITPILGAGSDPWRPSGGGSVYAVVPGAPAIGTAFDIAQTTKVPVIGGMWYEASAYISSHRCTSYVAIAWFDSNNTYINEVGGSQVAVAASGALTNWSRSTLLAQAPANAARAHFYVRSIVNSTDPYCFVAFAYLGKAVQGQAVFSDWSEGTSAGVSSGEVVTAINAGNTTTINGGRITTGSITANQIAANSITGNNIAANVAIAAPVINGGVINGGVINGVNITGAVIKASWIDYSTTGILTNWAYYTAATMPTQYANNFAHDSLTGTLLTDVNGYVRLPKVSKVVIDAYSYKVGRAANVYNIGNLSFAGYSLNVRSYDSYTTTSTRRLLDRNSRIVFDSTGYIPADSIPFLQLTGGMGTVGGATGSCTAEWRIGTDAFSYYGYTANQGSSPKLNTTRLAKNGVYLFDVTGSDTTPMYAADFVSSGITTHVQAMGASLSVTIVNLAHNIVDYIGQDADIAIGPCSGYASEGLNVSMSVVIPTGTETY